MLFWVVSPCTLADKDQRFGGRCCFHLHDIFPIYSFLQLFLSLCLFPSYDVMVASSPAQFCFQTERVSKNSEHNSQMETVCGISGPIQKDLWFEPDRPYQSQR